MKVLAHMGDQLSIGRMIDRLDADNPRLEAGLALLQVSQEQQLRHCGSGQQNVIGSPKSLRHLVEEAVLVIWMIVYSRTRILRMAVDVVIGRVHDRFVESRV